MTTPGSGRSSIGVRVRPNADNFIRDLKAQLKTKQQTYWVDVRARTAEATKDVRAWAYGPLQKINASVPLRVSTTLASSQMADWRRKQTANAVTIKVNLDTSEAVRELVALRAMANKSISVPVSADQRGGVTGGGVARVKPVVDPSGFKRSLDKFLADQQAGVMRITPELELDPSVKRGFQQRLNELTKDQKVRVDADTKDAERSMRSLLDKFGSKPQKVKLDLELDEKFDYKFRNRLKKLEKEAASRKVKVGVEAELEEVENEIEQLRVREKARKLGIEIEPEVDAKSLRLQMARLRLMEEKNKLALEVSIQTDSISKMRKALDAIQGGVGSFATLRSIDLGPITLGKPTGLISTLTTLTALGGLMPGIITGVGALSDVFMQLAGAASIVPGAIGGIMASLATFSIGSQGVGDAIGEMFDLWNEGASKQAKAAHTAVQAQNTLRSSQDSYRNAVIDEAKAQKDVAQARKDALGELRNLNNELRGSVLNEAQAILDAQKARDRYAQGLAEGFDTETDRSQALLDIAKADQNILDVRERNITLQDRVNTANQQGVEGSDRVTEALEAQTRAAQATQQSAAALQAATVGLTEAQGEGGTAMQQFMDKVGLLSPNAQQFVMTLMGMRGEIMGFRNALQDTIFQGLGPAFENMFTNIMPVIGPGMQEIAKGINSNILQVFDSIQSPEGQSIIERILGGTAEAQQAMSGLIDPMMRGLGTLMAAGAEHLPQVVDLFTRLADRFANFIEEADRSGALDKFMDEGITALGNFAEIGIDLLDMINSFQTAFRTAFGEDALGMLTRLVDKWARWLESDTGQKQLLDFIAAARDLWEDWRPVLEDLPGMFSAASDAARAFLGPITDMLGLFTELLEHAPWLVQGFMYVWAGSKIVDSVAGVAKSLGLVIVGLKEIPNLVGRLTGLPIPEWMLPDRNKPGAGGAGGAGGRAPGGANAPKPGPGSLGKTAWGAALGLPGTIAALAIFSYPSVQSAADADQAREAAIGEVNKKLPPDTKPITGSNADMATAGGLENIAKQGDPSAKWVVDAAEPIERSMRYAWVMSHPTDPANFKAPSLEELAGFFGTPVPSFGVGGYTNWPMQTGQPAILHGKEYVQPADTTAYYGRDTMEAIHDRRIPREVLQGFQSGGYFDPATGQWVPEQPLRAEQPNPVAGGWQTAINTGVGAIPGVINNALNPAAPAQPSPTTPGPQVYNPNALFGPAYAPAPGPQGAIPGTPFVPGDPSGGVATPDDEQKSFNLFGFNVPLGEQPRMDLSKSENWPFGIPGVGKPGTTHKDAGKWLADWGAKTILGVGENLLSGFLGFFGAEGLLNNKYMNAARTAIGYYSNLGVGEGAKVQAPGAEASNAAVQHGISTWQNMPTNPAYPGYGQMPNVYGPSGSYLQPGQMPLVDAAGNPIAVGPTAIPGKEFEGSGVINPQKGSEYVATHAQAPNAQVVPNANIMSYLKEQAAKFGLTANPSYRYNEPSSQHAIGRALDLFGTPEQRRAFLEWWHSDPSRTAATRMMIDDNNTDLEAYAGVAGTGPYGRGDHPDHIHAALEGVPVSAFLDPAAAGSFLPTVPGYGAGPTTPAGADSFLENALAAPMPSAPVLFPAAPQSDTGGGIVFPGATPSPAGPASGAGGAGSYTPGTNPLNVMAGPGGGPDKQSLKKVAQMLYMQAGMPPGEWKDFDWLIQKESSWNPTAQNPKSTAYGLGQFLDSTWDDVGGTKTSDPVKQLMLTFAYIKQRYHGSPAEAKRFHNANNWYDQGGWLPPGQTHVYNGTGEPELVVPMSKLKGFYNGGYASANPDWDIFPPTGPGDQSTWVGVPDRSDGTYRPVPPPWGSAPGVGGISVPGFTAPGLPFPGMTPGDVMPPQITANLPQAPIIFTPPSFYSGGYNYRTAIPVPRPPRPAPPSRGEVAKPKIVPARPKITPSPSPAPPQLPAQAPAMQPAPVPPPILPTAPPVGEPHLGTGAPPGPGRPSNEVAYGPQPINAQPGAESLMHLHPAARKGIASGAATLGSLADMAAAAGSFGIGGAAGAIGGGMGGGMGGGGLSLGGLFQQGGKIVEDIANVGASFLVGNITGGTTANAYGVTQRASNPSGGTRVVDASNNQYGDIYTNNLDDYFRTVDRREAQRAQSNLGRWGR